MRMLQYPDCPHCENANTSISIVDVEIGGIRLKGIQCNDCKSFIAYYKDYDSEFESIKESIEALDSRIGDLE